MRSSLLLTAAAVLCAGPAFADFSLTILHTNDFHSRIEPINKYDSTCSAEDDAEGKCFGGSARLYTAIAEERSAIEANGGLSLLVDGGDQFQGSLFYTYHKGKAAAQMMNALGYEAMTVGNHEFDDGPEVLRGFMDAIDFPILLANADISAEPQLADVLQPATVITKGGEKIGLIGLTPIDTAELSSPGPNVSFVPPGPALEKQVAALQADGVNKIIVLSHSGYSVDLKEVAVVPGVDVVVGGHSNTLLSNVNERSEGPYPTWVDQPDGGKAAVVQAYAYGKFLGKLTVTWDDEGAVSVAEGEPLLMDASVAENAGLKAKISELAEPLDEIRNEVVAVTTAPIDGDRASCRAKVCEMGVLVADAMLDRVKGQGVTIAITNGGGLRASIDEGEVTMGEVLTVLPFQNTLSTFRIKGAQIRAALENGFSQVEEGAGRFPQIAGMKVSWSKTKPAGERVQSVEVQEGDGWAPLDDDAVYSVVTNNFVRNGGDGYAMFKTEAMDPYDYGPGLEQVVADYLVEHGPYTPMTDDRLSEAQ